MTRDRNMWDDIGRTMVLSPVVCDDQHDSLRLFSSLQVRYLSANHWLPRCATPLKLSNIAVASVCLKQMLTILP